MQCVWRKRRRLVGASADKELARARGNSELRFEISEPIPFRQPESARQR